MNGELVIRECAFEVMKIGPGTRGRAALMEALSGPMRRMLACPDLLALGERRQANHIKNSKYLYYDGQLIFTFDEFPKGKPIPPHDHGVWEALGIYRGRVSHTVFRRIDDGTRKGYAELEPVDDRVLAPGDMAIVAEPADIHAFVALEEGTHAIVVVGGHYKEVRQYFDPVKKTCVARNPQARSAAGPVNLLGG